MEKRIRLRIGTVLNDNRIDILSEDGGSLLHDLCRVIEQELDRAREEGKREALEQIQRFVEDEMLVITRDGTDILEKYIKEWLSKLTTK